MLVAAITYAQGQNEPSYPQMLELNPDLLWPTTPSGVLESEPPILLRKNAEAAVREYFDKSPIAQFEWFGSWGDLEAEFADGDDGEYVFVGFPKDVRDSLKQPE